MAAWVKGESDNLFPILVAYWECSEAYSEPCQIPKMEKNFTFKSVLNMPLDVVTEKSLLTRVWALKLCGNILEKVAGKNKNEGGVESDKWSQTNLALQISQF